MVRSVLLLIVLLFICQNGHSQDSEESIRKRIEIQKDTSLIDAYLELGKYYFINSGKGDSLLLYANKALFKSRELQSERREANALIYIGAAYHVQNNYKLSEKHWLSALKIAKRINNIELLSGIYNKLGLLYFNWEKRNKAIDHFINGIKYAKKLKDYNQLCISYYGISSVYVMLDQPEKQLIYIRKALSLFENHTITEENQEIIYGAASQLYFENSGGTKKDLLDLCNYYANKGFEIVSRHDWIHRKPTYLNVFSAISFSNGDYTKSLKLCEETLELLAYVDKKDTELGIHLRMAKIYSLKNNKQLAYQYIDSALRNPLAKEDYFGMKVAILSTEVYKKYGDYKLALAAFEKQKELEGKLHESGKAKMINELETKYQSELKDANIAKLNQQNKIDTLEIEKKRTQIVWLFGVVILVLFALSIILFIFRQRSIKRSLQILETEQRLNRARMDPHFFFNALTTIQTLALKEQSPKTVLLLSKFSKIMRQSLESTYEEMVTIEDDIAFLSKYIDLQKMRHPGVFDYHIVHDDEIEINEILVPGMILQPFIENSIEHGFKNMQQGGEIYIKFQIANDSLLISVKDNGKSNASDDSSKSHTSRAIQIITDRLYLLKKQTKKEASFEIVRIEEEMGYQINLTLPLIYKEP